MCYVLLCCLNIIIDRHEHMIPVLCNERRGISRIRWIVVRKDEVMIDPRGAAHVVDHLQYLGLNDLWTICGLRVGCLEGPGTALAGKAHGVMLIRSFVTYDAFLSSGHCCGLHNMGSMCCLRTVSIEKYTTLRVWKESVILPWSPL